MFVRLVHKDDIPKVLETMEITLFTIQDDIERPVAGVGAVKSFAPGELTEESAREILLEAASELPESGSGIYYSAMLGFWDYSGQYKNLVYMMEAYEGGGKPVYFGDDRMKETDFFTGESIRYII